MDKTKAKSLNKSLDNLKQNLLQLKLDLQSAQAKNNPQLVKDISRSIATTEALIKRLNG